MARPTKQGIDYFPYDADLDQDDKLGMIIGEYGDKGENLYTKVLCWIYKHEGYFSRWDEDVQLRFLRRYSYCGFSVSFIQEVVPRFIKWGLFDKTVFNAFSILTSHRIQKTWLEASRKRSSRYVFKNIWLLPVNDGLQAEEMEEKTEETTQKESKVKETKLNQSKVKPNGVAPAKPPPAKKIINPEKQEVPELYWKKLVKAWFEFYKEKFKIDPSFKDEDPRVLKKIIQQLKHRQEKKNVEWTENVAVEKFKFFLEYAYKIDWLKKNFLLKNLREQFDVIIQPKAKVQVEQPNNHAPPSKIFSKTEKDINFLYEMFLEGSVKIGTYSSEYFDYLQSKGVKLNEKQQQSVEDAALEHMEAQQLSNKPETITGLKKVFGVIEYFKFLKKKGYATVFRME